MNRHKLDHACFDGRILSFPPHLRHEVANHMVWRSLRDCRCNAVSKSLHKVSTASMIQLMKDKYNFNFDHVPAFLKYGTFAKFKPKSSNSILQFDRKLETGMGPQFKSIDNKMIRVAGEVLFSSDYTHVVLVKKLSTGRYSLPKGKVESGETWLQGAARERLEETGIPCNEVFVLHVDKVPVYVDELNHNDRVSCRYTLSKINYDLSKVKDLPDYVTYNGKEVAHWFTLSEIQRLPDASFAPRRKQLIQIALAKIIDCTTNHTVESIKSIKSTELEWINSSIIYTAPHLTSLIHQSLHLYSKQNECTANIRFHNNCHIYGLECGIGCYNMSHN